MSTAMQDGVAIQASAIAQPAASTQKSVCYSTFRACHEACRESGNDDAFCHADCEIDLLRCLNAVIGDELCGACSDLAHQRLVAVVGRSSRSDTSWWRRLGEAMRLDGMIDGLLREMQTTGGKILTLLVGVVYTFVYGQLSRYIGPRADAGSDDPGGGAGSSIKSFYESLEPLEIALIALPGIAAVALFLTWLVGDRAEISRRLLNWLNETSTGRVTFFAMFGLMCIGLLLIAVGEIRLFRD